MTGVQAAALILVALLAPAVVFTSDPRRQAIVVGIFGFALGILFFAFQAPDVALSQIVVGSIALPAMILLALGKVRERERARRGGE